MRLTSCGHSTSTAIRGPAGLCDKCRPIGLAATRLRQAATLARAGGLRDLAQHLREIAEDPEAFDVAPAVEPRPADGVLEPSRSLVGRRF